MYEFLYKNKGMGLLMRDLRVSEKYSNAVFKVEKEEKRSDNRKFYRENDKFFPKTREGVANHISEYQERLDTIVIEEIIMPEVIDLLKKIMTRKNLKKYLIILKMYVLILMII